MTFQNDGSGSEKDTATLSSKIVAFFQRDLTPKQIRFRAIVLASLGVMFVLALFIRFSFTNYLRVDSAKESIPLAGEWKILYADDPGAIAVDYDDSGWCRVMVPDPNVAKLKEPSQCPDENYPRMLMLGKIFFYRKRVAISEGVHFKKPGMFLGALKEEAWIYWDGAFIGHQRIEAYGPLVLDAQQTRPGSHEIAIKMYASPGTAFPGMFHGLKDIRIDEFSNVMSSFRWQLFDNSIVFYATAVIQIAMLLLLLYFALRSPNVTEDTLWLMLYLASAATLATSFLFPRGGVYRVIEQECFIGLSVSLTCFGIAASGKLFPSRSLLLRMILVFGTGAFALQLSGFLFPQSFLGQFQTLYKWVILLSIITTVIAFVAIERIKAMENDESLERINQYLIFGLLLLNHGFHAINEFPMANSTASFHLSPLTTIFTFFIAILTIEKQIGKERRLAFYGRFIRVGLKNLLNRITRHESISSTPFRKVITAIFKVDLCNSTLYYLDMPYGPKIDFTNTWYTKADRVVGKSSFHDKGEGDGFIFYLKETVVEGPVSKAIECVLKIQQYAVFEFFANFKDQLMSKMEREPELKPFVEAYFERFKNKTGLDFLTHTPEVKAAIVFGIMDEGLWGSVDRSHYDMQGMPLVELARLEKEAKPNEIIMSKQALLQWKQEAGYSTEKLLVSAKTGNLRGIGVAEYYLITPNRQPRSSEKKAS